MTVYDDVLAAADLLKAKATDPAELRVRDEAACRRFLDTVALAAPPNAGSAVSQGPGWRWPGAIAGFGGIPVRFDPYLPDDALALLDHRGNLIRIWFLDTPLPAFVPPGRPDIDDGQLEWILIACVVFVVMVWAVSAPALLLGRGL